MVVAVCKLRGGAVAVGYAQRSAVLVGLVVWKLVGMRTREGASHVLFHGAAAPFT